jgi:DNA-binding NarL/FixJ family response regulator
MTTCAAIAVVDVRPLVRLGVEALFAPYADRLLVWASTASVAELSRVPAPRVALRGTAVVLGRTSSRSRGAEVERLFGQGHAVVALDDRRGPVLPARGVRCHPMAAPAEDLVNAVDTAITEFDGVWRGPLPELVSSPALTPREALVLQAVAAGRGDKQIAAELVIGQSTVKEYLKRIRRKYAEAGRPVGNRVELLVRAIEDGHVDGGAT